MLRGQPGQYVSKNRFLRFDLSLYKVILFAALVTIDLINGAGLGVMMTISAFVLGISNIISME